jgi:hypothetical protein
MGAQSTLTLACRDRGGRGPAAGRLRETPRFLGGVLGQLARDRATLGPASSVTLQEAPHGSARDPLQAA